MVGSALFAFPVGVMSGIYMNEYAPKGKLVRFIRVMTNNLSGIPSIVFGLFGMALFVNYMGFGDSILAGSLTLFYEFTKTVNIGCFIYSVFCKTFRGRKIHIPIMIEVISCFGNI